MISFTIQYYKNVDNKEKCNFIICYYSKIKSKRGEEKEKLERCKKKSRCYLKILDNDIISFTNHKTSKLTDYEVKQAHKFYKNFLHNQIKEKKIKKIYFFKHEGISEKTLTDYLEINCYSKSENDIFILFKLKCN